ncbi:MAG TPA: hypothetical protein VME41_13235 [Stellaceae bacterium]|nr:hypothetical protein [Stellaceae bacterium]
MACTLFVHDERPGGGIAAIPLDRVKHAVELKVIEGKRVETHSFSGGHGSVVLKTAASDDLAIILQIEEPAQPPREYRLADWPRAVAVATTEKLYWLLDKSAGRWVAEAADWAPAQAHSRVESRFFPDGYDLPPAAAPAVSFQTRSRR